jgi:hypothetical protein
VHKEQLKKIQKRISKLLFSLIQFNKLNQGKSVLLYRSKNDFTSS